MERRCGETSDRFDCRISGRAERAADRRFPGGDIQGVGRIFLRLGGGSLGGKARGLAFVRHLLHTRIGVAADFPGVRIAVPPTLVLATDIFDQFLNENNLADFAIRCDDDAEIVQRFLRGIAAGAGDDGAAGIPGASALSAGGAFVEPAGGFAISAIHRRVSDIHAAESG